jgi:hypothetical protein
MINKIRRAVSVSLGIAVVMGVSTDASAANVVTTWGPLTVAGFTGSGSVPRYAWDGNNNRSSITGKFNYGWQHNSDFYLFSVADASSVGIKMTSPVGGINPAFTLWTATSRGVGHTYNQVGPTPYFLPDGESGFVGYANAGPTGWTNGYGLDGSGLGGVVGTGSGGTATVAAATSTSAGLADLVIGSLGPGNYMLGVGGSCNTAAPPCSVSTAGFSYNLSLTNLGAPVPIPAAVWLFGSALAGLGWVGRGKRKPPAHDA